MLHGWPGSFLQMLPLLPHLVGPKTGSSDDGVAFDVVAPSLPGFGFSEIPADRRVMRTDFAFSGRYSRPLL
jgi:pimeloyl-ACP methyl ester carboxylesterase